MQLQAGMLHVAVLVILCALEQTVANPRYSGLACDGSRLRLNCTAGYSMHIEMGFWGRDDADTCQPTPAGNQKCNSHRALDDLRSVCEDKRSCVVTASSRLFGDPCQPHTNKYLRTMYTCKQVAYKALVCENTGKLSLACPQNRLILPQSAFFGRDDNNLTCPHLNAMVSTNCYSNKSFDIFRELCFGRQQCEVEARVEVFGEPCFGIYKYLRLSYLCAECKNVRGDDAQCEMWANRGNCTTDKAWMLANCLKACTKCEVTAPACVNAVGNDTACERWSADGYCKSSPAYMNAYCRKTCSKCDQKTQCVNKNTQFTDSCQAWADRGECADNPNFMLTRCSKACFRCEGHIRCENVNVNATACRKWATNGECGTNPGYMMTRCLKECTACTADPPCVNIEPDTQCKSWAEQGDCRNNSVWMFKNCWKACVQCEQPSVCINKYSDSAACDDWAKANECGSVWMEKNCAKSCANDAYGNWTACATWAADGECDQNSGWMTTNCRRSCGKCELTECRNKVSPTSSCASWAADGQCKANMGWMERHCSKSCFQCDGTVACVNRAGNAKCEMFTVRGECDINPGYMFFNCLKSCVGCSSDPVCKNEYTNSTSCHAWALGNQCQINPGWMHRNCWQACVNCSGGPVECTNSYGNDAQCESWALLGECQNNPLFMLTNCHFACSRCKPVLIKPNCVNAYGNDTACDLYASNGQCYTNPTWMLPYCMKSCTQCAQDALTRGSVGSDATPGDTNKVTRYRTFVLDEISSSGRLTHFSGFFAAKDPIHLQIWRSNNVTFVPLYDRPFRPARSNTAQTVLVSDRCVQVQKGDRLGFTSINNVAPLATNYDEKSLTRKVLYRAANSRQFDSTSFAIDFSIAASYDKTRSCGGG